MQLWIDALLRADIPVSDDVVVLLSELAVHRVALDILLRDWEFLALAWDNELCGRHDRTTSRQHGIMAEPPFPSERHFLHSQRPHLHMSSPWLCISTFLLNIGYPAHMLPPQHPLHRLPLAHK